MNTYGIPTSSLPTKLNAVHKTQVLAATTVFAKPWQMPVSHSRNKDVVTETIFQIKSGMQTVNKI